MPGTPEARSTDSALERRRLEYVLSEALERRARLQQILLRQEVFIAGERVGGEPANALQKLRDRLKAHTDAFLAESDRAASALRDCPLNPGEQAGLTAALDILITGIRRVHELLVLLPREAAKPQASFLLQDCFGRTDLKASIVLTNSLSAYEYRFEDVLEKFEVEQQERETLTQGGNVLCQAFADRDNPLAWAVLAHEYGHALDDSHTISHGVLGGDESGDEKRANDPKVARQHDLQKRVVAETVADFVAARVLGPASLMPILFLEMLHPKRGPVGKKSSGHPPTPLRVELVNDYLRGVGVSTADFADVFEAYSLDYKRKLQGMDPKDRGPVELMGEQAEKILRPLAPTIAARVDALGLPIFGQGNATAARELQQVLARRQPISGKRHGTDKEIYDELSTLTAGSTTREDAYRVLMKLDERRVAGSEILTAGWLHRLSSFKDKLLEAFPGEGAKPKLDCYSDYVEKIDDWLSKSLEVTAVHAEVLRRLSGGTITLTAE
jgi:hypothetical protein